MRSLFIVLLIFNLSCSTSSRSSRELDRKERARLLVDVANGSLAEGDPTGALQSLYQAELEDGSLPELHHSKALAYYAKKDFRSALDAAQEAVHLKPDYSEANSTLGKLLIDLKEYSKASEVLLKAAKNPLYREAYKAWTGLGVIEYRRGREALALTYLDQAITIQPLQACVAYYYRGNILSSQKKFPEAIRDYMKATRQICTSFPDAQLALGNAYYRTQQYQQARQTYLQIQEMYKNTPYSEKAFTELKKIP